VSASAAWPAHADCPPAAALPQAFRVYGFRPSSRATTTGDAFPAGARRSPPRKGKGAATGRHRPLKPGLGQRGADGRVDLLIAVDIPALGDDLGPLYERDPELVEPRHNANDLEAPCVRVDEAGRVAE
jgi:hypothetical protein